MNRTPQPRKAISGSLHQRLNLVATANPVRSITLSRKTGPPTSEILVSSGQHELDRGQPKLIAELLT
jgi:hypothetical protein